MSSEQPKTTGGDTVLIDRILADAREEARKIREDAESSVATRRKALEKRLAEMDVETESRVAEEREKQRARADSAISLAEGRMKLRVENRVYELARERCLAEMKKMRQTPEYKRILRDWIVEASRGLGGNAAVVRCPPEDSAAVESVLRDAQDILSSEYGMNVELQFDRKPVSGQGVVLRDPRARLSFTNTVQDRMRRYAGELRRIVYHSVIEGINGRTDHR